MKQLVSRIWYAEPARFVAAVTAAWGAVVALDQGSDSWFIPLWVYIVAVPLTTFLGEAVRNNVTPVNDGG